MAAAAALMLVTRSTRGASGQAAGALAPSPVPGRESWSLSPTELHEALAAAGLEPVTAAAAGAGAADLSLAVADTPEPVAAGALLTYTFRVQNAGPDAAAEVVAVALLPAGATATYVWPPCRAVPSGGRAAIVCPVGALGTGATTWPRVVVRVPAGASGTLSAAAQVLSASADPNPGNNAAMATTAVLAPTPTATASRTPTERVSIRVVDSTGDAGRWTSMVLDASGNPTIAYQDVANQDLKLLRCADPACSAIASMHTVDAAGNTGLKPSLRLDAAANPVVLYYDQGNGDLRFVQCTNGACSAPQCPVTLDAAGNTGAGTSLVLDSAGNPVIAFYNFFGINVARCSDPYCADAPTITTPHAGPWVGEWPSLALDGTGVPVVSYSIGPEAGGGVLLLHCVTPTCAPAAHSIVVVDPGIDVESGHTSLALDTGGLPATSYYDRVAGDLRVVRCGNANCTAGVSVERPDAAGCRGRKLRLRSGAGSDGPGWPVLEHGSTSQLPAPSCPSAQLPLWSEVLRPHSWWRAAQRETGSPVSAERTAASIMRRVPRFWRPLISGSRPSKM